MFYVLIIKENPSFLIQNSLIYIVNLQENTKEKSFKKTYCACEIVIVVVIDVTSYYRAFSYTGIADCDDFNAEFLGFRVRRRVWF